jgi:hypothetical protein
VVLATRRSGLSATSSPAAVLDLAGSPTAQRKSSCSVADLPTDILQTPAQRGCLFLPFGVTLVARHQHADAAHPIRLLRARRAATQEPNRQQA